MATTRMATRLVQLQWMLYFAERLKVRESGGNNHGPIVEALQEADALPGKFYAWCQSTLNGAYRLATGGHLTIDKGRFTIIGGDMFMGGTASVGQAVAMAGKLGCIVTRPFRGDCFAMQLDGDNWPDHTGQIVRVLSLRYLGYYLCRTVEGNTGDASLADGDGVFVKTRMLRSSRTVFYRPPGYVLDPHLPPTRKV